MPFLTDRTLATGVTLQDLIHIVITGDTSQGNFAGSSYKATIGQVFDSISGYCISDLYVSNFHSCSPLNINPLDEGNVYFGSTSGVTVDVTNKRIGINTDTPDHELHIIGDAFIDGNLTATTISATTYYNLPTSYYTTTGITTSQSITWDKTYWGISGLTNVDITLPSTTSKDGYSLTIKDERGTAGSYRIRVTPTSGLIDGNTYIDMNINYMSLTFVARNNNWWII